MNLLVARTATVLVPGLPQAKFWSDQGLDARRIERIASIYCPVPGPFVDVPICTTLLFVGRPMPLKGFDRFIDVVERFPTVSAKAILGEHCGQFSGSDDSYLDRCMERARQLPKLDVMFDVTNVEDQMAKGSLLVVPNRILPNDPVSAEGWGRVVEEALFHGIPVVSTDAVPSAVTLIEDGVNGRVVASTDDEALFAAVAAALAGTVFG